MNRCSWVDMNKHDYIDYHDTEWGVPIYNDQKMFECLILESAQAGLSWYTVLKKRNNYRLAFDGFNPKKISLYDNKKINQLLHNKGIIRHRSKIEAAINNARCYLEIQEQEGGFAKYLWQFVENKPQLNKFKIITDYPTTTAESIQMNNALKSKGFKFIGPTICYAFMQAVGMVNNHVISCYRHQEIANQYQFNLT